VFILHILPEDKKPMAVSILLIVIAHFNYTKIGHLGKHKIMRNGHFMIHYKSDQQTHVRTAMFYNSANLNLHFTPYDHP